MTDEKFFDELSSMINNAFDGAFGRKTGNRTMPNTKILLTSERLTKLMEKNPSNIGETNTQDLSDFVVKEDSSDTIPALYESIEDYTAKTGKRFRMTKRQKELKMTREEAFKLTHGEC
tara:strand:+ start:514 stop:867 length:354 start_codon:yes stop_codon:yes gene_type:complete